MQSILNYKMVLLEQHNNIEIVNLIENFILEKARISVIYTENDIFEGIYVYSEVYKEKVYDFDNNQFISITSEKYNVVDFEFNTAEKCLMIWSNKKGALKVISLLSLIFNNQIIIEPFELSFEKAINFLKETSMVKVGKVKAKNVILEKDLVAECIFDLSITDKPFAILEKYKENIKNIIFEISDEKNSLRLTLYQSGALVVHKNKDLIPNNLLKKVNQIMIRSRR